MAFLRFVLIMSPYALGFWTILLLYGHNTFIEAEQKGNSLCDWRLPGTLKILRPCKLVQIHLSASAKTARLIAPYFDYQYFNITYPLNGYCKISDIDYRKLILKKVFVQIILVRNIRLK